MNFHNTTQGREYGRKSSGLSDENEALARELKRIIGEAKSAVDGMKATTTEHNERLIDVEQKLARRGVRPSPTPRNPGVRASLKVPPSRNSRPAPASRARLASP